MQWIEIVDFTPFDQRTEPVIVTEQSRAFATAFMAHHWQRAHDFDCDCQRRMGVLNRKPLEPQVGDVSDDDDGPTVQPDWELRRILRLPGLWATATDEYKAA